MTDNYAGYTSGLDSPGEHLFAITPGTAFPTTTRALFLGVAGAVNLTTAGGETLTVTLTAGWHPLRVASVASSATTATGLLGTY